MAHVKWFEPYTVSAEPRALHDVLTRDFWGLLCLAIALCWLFAYLEKTTFGAVLHELLDSITTTIRERTDLLLRAAAGAFFVALFALGGIILTPELKTDAAAIPWVQLAIAAGLLGRRTTLLSALGIVGLFIFAVTQYGVFHLMDYPIFLGLAIWLALYSVGPVPFLPRPIAILRWGAGITLLWASVEKWAYPQWSFPILATHPNLAMGLQPDFYMTAAGMVEFGLAFGLLWTPLVRRIAGLALAAMFVSAVLEFGKIDAIGHSVIIAILIAIMADRPPALQQRAILAPAGLCAALVATLLAYYGGHAALFDTHAHAGNEQTITRAPASQGDGGAPPGRHDDAHEHSAPVTPRFVPRS